ncbi:MAG: iron-sulfur cluster insertion protein ErpA [Beijerinckiaceae bacterium]|nr:iron-sulfur cluster insertion protein ErpA [Beijerinckiaceae bacterium]
MTDFEANSTSITVSESAAQRVAQILRGEPEGSMLRVSVEGGGCSGFQYKFGFDRSKAEDDIALQKNGVTVLIDATSAPFLEGSEIDFVDDLMGQSFRVHNPNATSSCGCGTSFSV